MAEDYKTPNSETLPDEIIAFDDYNRRRRLVLDKAAEAVKTSFPLKNERYELHVEDVGYDSDVDKPFTVKQQKQAILEGRTLAKPLKGRFVLKDAVSGQVVEKGGRRVIANIPYMTPRGTFIRNGSELVVMNQLRLRPGVYSRKTNDGDMEAMVNVKPGTGTQFKMRFDPRTALFTIHAGGRKFSAYPVLKQLGVEDERLKSLWGEDIFNKNAAKTDSRAVHAAESVFLPKTPTQQEN